MRSPLPVPFSRTQYIGSQLQGERNDCSVRALMTAAQIPYAASHALLARECARRTGGRTKTALLVRLLDSGSVPGAAVSPALPSRRTACGTGWKPRWDRTGRVTLATFLRRNPEGRFYCHITGHAFAVVDGVLHDTWAVPAGSLVEAAWRVTPEAALPAAEKAAPAAARAYKFPPPAKALRAALDAALLAAGPSALASVDAALLPLAALLEGVPYPRHEARCSLRRAGVERPPQH